MDYPQLKDTCFVATKLNFADGPPQTYFVAKCTNANCGQSWQKLGEPQTPPAMLRRWFISDNWLIDQRCRKALCPSCGIRARDNARTIRKKINKHKTVEIVLHEKDQWMIDELHEEIDIIRDLLNELERKVNQKIYTMMTERI